MCYGEAEIISQLVEEVRAFREMLGTIETQRRKIPALIDESFSDNASTTIYVKPRTHNLEWIKTVYVYLQYVGASGFGTMTLGDHSIPVAQGWTQIDNATFMLTETAKRQLASGSATAGTMTLILMGEDLADKGNF